MLNVEVKSWRQYLSITFPIDSANMWTIVSDKGCCYIACYHLTEEVAVKFVTKLVSD